MWNVTVAIVEILALLLFWFVVGVVIPGVIALYLARLFPLTGQWRKRWAGYRQSNPSRRASARSGHAPPPVGPGAPDGTDSREH
jgi:hypothetical protein